MLRQGEVSQLIRKKCGIHLQKEEDYLITTFSKDEQLVILAHIIKQEEVIKEANLNSELIKSITDRVMQNLKEEKVESEAGR